MKKIVLGNWKSLGDTASNAVLLAALAAHPPAAGVEVGVCVPCPCLTQARAVLEGTAIGWGAQNVSPFGAGAYTGEVHAGMLAEFGCRYALVGHSERRQLFAETDERIADKIDRLLAANVRPVVCVGETLAEREAGGWRETLGRQVAALAARLGPEKLSRAWFAYEPVWAIGTGRVAAPADIAEAHAFLRERLMALGVPAEEVVILYGGSVKADNAQGVFAVPGCDGALVGAASRVVEEFIAIVAAAGAAVVRG